MAVDFMQPSREQMQGKACAILTAWEWEQKDEEGDARCFYRRLSVTAYPLPTLCHLSQQPCTGDLHQPEPLCWSGKQALPIPELNPCCWTTNTLYSPLEKSPCSVDQRGPFPSISCQQQALCESMYVCFPVRCSFTKGQMLAEISLHLHMCV